MYIYIYIYIHINNDCSCDFPLNPSANSRMNSDHHFHGHPSERFHPSNSNGTSE